MGWAKSPDICEPVQRLLHWLMLLWLVPPACALAGVNGFRGGTDFAKSAYLGGPRFFVASPPEPGSFTIIVASAVSGMVRDGPSSGSGASTPLACSLYRISNHLPLTFSRVYLHGALVLALPVALSPSVLASPIAHDSIGPRRSSATQIVVPISSRSAEGRDASILFCSFLAFAYADNVLRPMSPRCLQQSSTEKRPRLVAAVGCSSEQRRAAIPRLCVLQLRCVLHGFTTRMHPS